MSIYVSAYYENINSHRDNSFYLEKSIPFLTCNVNKIIFTTNSLYEKLKIYENDFTSFYILDVVPFQKYKNMIFNFDINTKNKNKDTIDYILLQLSKTEFIKLAIEKLPNYNTYFWIDFGIAYNMKYEDSFDEFRRLLVINSDKIQDPNKIRIPGCWNLNNKYKLNINRTIHWYFAGSLFSGSKDSLLKFANLVEDKILEFMKSGSIIWEVNIWFFVYSDNPELFDWYYGNHNLSMLRNY